MAVIILLIKSNYHCKWCNGAFVTKDANATSGTNTFTFGDKIYIKVPVKNVNQSSEIKITAQGSYIRYSGKLYDCTHVGNSIENQNVVDYDITEGKRMQVHL